MLSNFHKVVWTDSLSTLLAYRNRRIIDDRRISVERPLSTDWNLHIRHISMTDQGFYKCQINTIPVMFKTINLFVEGKIFLYFFGVGY